MTTQKDDRLERRISELTKWLIAHVRNDITVDGPRTVTPDRVWRLKDANGRIVHVLRVTQLALDGERDLGKDLTQQWLERWGESRCFRLRSDGLLEPCPGANLWQQS